MPQKFDLKIGRKYPGPDGSRIIINGFGYDTKGVRGSPERMYYPAPVHTSALQSRGVVANSGPTYIDAGFSMLAYGITKTVPGVGVKVGAFGPEAQGFVATLTSDPYMPGDKKHRRVYNFGADAFRVSSDIALPGAALSLHLQVYVLIPIVMRYDGKPDEYVTHGPMEHSGRVRSGLYIDYSVKVSMAAPTNNSFESPDKFNIENVRVVTHWIGNDVPFNGWNIFKSAPL
jgi:hypothetical protein